MRADRLYRRRADPVSPATQGNAAGRRRLGLYLSLESPRTFFGVPLRQASRRLRRNPGAADGVHRRVLYGSGRVRGGPHPARNARRRQGAGLSNEVALPGLPLPHPDGKDPAAGIRFPHRPRGPSRAVRGRSDRTGHADAGQQDRPRGVGAPVPHRGPAEILHESDAKPGCVKHRPELGGIVHARGRRLARA